MTVNEENLVTPKQFATKLYEEEGVKVTDETIRNAIKENLIIPEIRVNKIWYIDFEKNRKYKPMKRGRPQNAF